MKKIYLKNKQHKKHILWLIIIIIIIIIYFLNKKITPFLKNYAELEIRKMTNNIIIKSVTIDSLKKITIEDLFNINKNNNNEILTIDLNTVIVNELIASSTANIQKNLSELENQNPILKIPIGTITNIFLLKDKGFKIPVKINVIGDIASKLDTKVKNYGINSAIIELNLNITINVEIILPISSENIKVTSQIPLAMKIINGTVPNFYSGEINKSSIFSIPIE